MNNNKNYYYNLLINKNIIVKLNNSLLQQFNNL